MPETHRDASADTARFQAFAARQDEELPAPWRTRASGSKAGLLAVIVIAVVVLAVILGVLLVG